MDALLPLAGSGVALAALCGYALLLARGLPGARRLVLSFAGATLALTGGAMLALPASLLQAWLPGASALLPGPAVGLAVGGVLLGALGVASWLPRLQRAEAQRQELFAEATRLHTLVGQQAEQLRSAQARVAQEAEERGKAESVRSGSQDLWRTLLDQAPSNILLVDRAGIILSLSKPLPGMQALLGQSLLNCLPARGRAAAERALAQVLSAGQPAGYEVLMPDGSVWTHRLGPVRRDGQVVAAVVVATDVSESRRTEEAQRVAVETQREVERLAEGITLRTQMLHTAAHELFNPLTPMRAQFHLLRAGGLDNLTEKQRKSLDMMERNVNRLTLLVNDMRDVGRIQNGRLNLSKAPVTLDDLVTEAVEAFAEQARTAGVKLETAPSSGLRVEADEQRLGQVLFNITSNAVKFTPAGGTVHLGCAVEGRMAVLRVRDSGRGLSREQMDRLFQPFSQVHDVRDLREKGSGLGLFICKGIAEAHEGRIWVESDGPGKGACFCVGLPLPAVNASAPVAEPRRVTAA